MTLRFSYDNGEAWVDAAEYNFPDEGVWFELEFPQGSDPVTGDHGRLKLRPTPTALAGIAALALKRRTA